MSLPTTYIEWRGGRASTAAEAEAGPADDEAGVHAGMEEDLGEDEEDSGLESSSESDAEDIDIEMPSASPLGEPLVICIPSLIPIRRVIMSNGVSCTLHAPLA